MRETLPPALAEPTVSLMERCRSGDREAFREVVERHQGYAFALAFRVLRRSEEAKDVVQESFLRVWAHRAEYDPRVKFTTWLYTIVVNLSTDLLRAQRRREKVFLRPDEEPGDAMDVHGENPEELAVNRDLAVRISRLADQLPEKQRIVFTLRDLQDQTIEDVSAIVGISREAVRTNLCFARAAIRAKLEGKREE